MAHKISPDKAQYVLGDTVRLTMKDVHGLTIEQIRLYKLHEQVIAQISVEPHEGLVQIIIKDLKIGSYGVEIIFGDEVARTAFDVVRSAQEVTRYGFLSDFSTNDADRDLGFLKDMHLNAIQFYDWMYRHDRLVSETRQYEDPLGRSTDLDVIRKTIESLKEMGIRPFAYGAVYAAGHALFEAHPEWGLYGIDGDPLVFDSWLHFMNIASESGWHDHIINEFKQAVSELGFMGIHMDTYGYPKIVSDSKGQTFSLQDVFPSLIDNAADALRVMNPANGVIFNAVNNWPVEMVANTKQDAIYIEVWPPHDTYFDLYRLIREAKLFGEKQVILAAYMHPFKEARTKDEIIKAQTALLLTQAVIHASGGTQLVFGEDQGVLCDSYYVRYKQLHEPFVEEVIRGQDHLVRVADLLYNDHGTDVSMTASGGINDDIRFVSEGIRFSPNGKAGTVWTIIRESPERLSIQLINLVNNDDLWNTPKDPVKPVRDIEVILRFDRKVTGIHMATPDDDGMIHHLAFGMAKTKQGRQYRFTLHELKVWQTIWVETES